MKIKDNEIIIDVEYEYFEGDLNGYYVHKNRPTIHFPFQKLTNILLFTLGSFFCHIPHVFASETQLRAKDIVSSVITITEQGDILNIVPKNTFGFVKKTTPIIENVFSKVFQNLTQEQGLALGVQNCIQMRGGFTGSMFGFTFFFVLLFSMFNPLNLPGHLRTAKKVLDALGIPFPFPGGDGQDDKDNESKKREGKNILLHTFNTIKHPSFAYPLLVLCAILLARSHPDKVPAPVLVVLEEMKLVEKRRTWAQFWYTFVNFRTPKPYLIFGSTGIVVALYLNRDKLPFFVQHTSSAAQTVAEGLVKVFNTLIEKSTNTTGKVEDFFMVLVGNFLHRETNTTDDLRKQTKEKEKKLNEQVLEIAEKTVAVGRAENLADAFGLRFDICTTQQEQLRISYKSTLDYLQKLEFEKSQLKSFAEKMISWWYGLPEKPSIPSTLNKAIDNFNEQLSLPSNAGNSLLNHVPIVFDQLLLGDTDTLKNNYKNDKHSVEGGNNKPAKKHFNK